MEPKKVNSDALNEFLIFQKWRDSSSLIKLHVDSKAHSVRLWARVASVDAECEEVVLAIEGEKPGRWTLKLADAVMRFGDSSALDPDTPLALKTEFAKTVDSMLTIFLPDREEVIIVWELRESE
jgi:hypothetical protein